jgi:hypothetical protein
VALARWDFTLNTPEKSERSKKRRTTAKRFDQQYERDKYRPMTIRTPPTHQQQQRRIDTNLNSDGSSYLE